MDRLITAEHLTTLGVIAIAIAALVTAARLRPGQWTVVAGRTLALVIMLNECGWWVWLAGQHTWSASYALPLQLCDVVAFVAAGALWFRHPLLVELTYFWGLAGTANALISPDLPDHFPSYLFLQYFIAHGAIVAAALFLVIGSRIAPRRGAVPRAVALTLALAAVDAGANLVTGGNYMYLRHTPAVASLLDLMGPWPWYIVVAAGLAIAIFVCLDLPFAISRRRPAPAHAGARGAEIRP
ncbi:MAG TPA: TIGR02206 family membrane protein [Candidatus Dormibacteraeota bacterium]|jgi:hypothetical integral membrane protein (TIGR02206 family)